MDNLRVPSDSFELVFFKIGVGTGEHSTLHSVTLPISATNSIIPVPMIAILTKYEAFIDRAKNNLKESRGQQPNQKQILTYLNEQVINNIKWANHPPATIVQTHHKRCSQMKVNSNEVFLDKGKGCDILAEKTYAAVKDEALANIFALSQKSSIRVSCEVIFRYTLQYVH